MPNLVVYVPADLWRRLEESGGEGWQKEARKLALRAIADFPALTERDQDAGHSAQTGQTAQVSRSVSADHYEHFKPDPK